MPFNRVKLTQCDTALTPDQGTTSGAQSHPTNFNQANLALDLAQTRYKLGLSSIIELSQAELNQTQARIVQASATYDYHAQYSVLNYELGPLH